MTLREIDVTNWILNAINRKSKYTVTYILVDLIGLLIYTHNNYNFSYS